MRGYTGFILSVCPSHRPSVCLSVRQSVCWQNLARSVSLTILARSISYLHILSSNFRCVACSFIPILKNVELLANSLYLQLWLVWVIMGRRRVGWGVGLSSQRKRSSCSSCNCVSWQWHNELNIDVLCCLKRVNQPPDLENVGYINSTIMIYDKTQGHNCDTKNQPVISRMQALSSTDRDKFWWHKT